MSFCSKPEIFDHLNKTYYTDLLVLRTLRQAGLKAKLLVFSQILDCKMCFYSDGKGKQVKPSKAFSVVGQGRKAEWGAEEKERPGEELPTM